MATLLAAMLVSMSGMAESWPDKPVNYIIPFGDGGESSTAANIQNPVFKRLTGRDLVILNKPGGGGAVVWSQLNKMPGDGSTIVGINLPHIILQPARGASYQTSDIAVVHIFHYTPNALIVAKGSPYETLADLIADARSRPRAIRISGSGKGTANHLAQLQFDKLAGIETKYRPYKGTGASIAALLAGSVDAAWGYLSVAPKHGKKIRLLGVATQSRPPLAPDTPTFLELGFEMTGGAYRGIAMPKSATEALRQAVSDIFAKIGKDTENIARNQAQGFVPIIVPYQDIAPFMATRQTEYLRLARGAGLIE
jgi:tripartite-type tricarboxylate transporter receptor subunit TctC